MPFVEIAPKRTVSFGGTHGDMEGMLPSNHPYSGFKGLPSEEWRYPYPADFCEVQGFASDDRVTDTHECCHGVNSRVRNENGVEVGLYYLNGKAFTIQSHPRFKLADLAKEIPSNKRGRGYSLYMVQQQRWWNDEPLYVLDELTAYTFGAKAGFELGMTDRAVYSRDNAREFWRYSRIAAQMARECGYEHQAELDEFLELFHKDHLSPLLTK